MSFFGKRYDQAHKIWKETGDRTGFLLSRAETLLERLEEPVPAGLIDITEADIDELHRIASAPQDGDGKFLARFDVIYEDDERRET